MKAKIIVFFMLVLVVSSCSEGYPKNITKVSMYIENRTDRDIKVVYIRTFDNTTVSAEIESGGEKHMFTYGSPEAYHIDLPSAYDSAYLYYADKILIDSIRGKGLLDSDSFIKDKNATYTKKKITYHKETLTIDSAYINSYCK